MAVRAPPGVLPNRREGMYIKQRYTYPGVNVEAPRLLRYAFTGMAWSALYFVLYGHGLVCATLRRRALQTPYPYCTPSINSHRALLIFARATAHGTCTVLFIIFALPCTLTRPIAAVLMIALQLLPCTLTRSSRTAPPRDGPRATQPRPSRPRRSRRTEGGGGRASECRGEPRAHRRPRRSEGRQWRVRSRCTMQVK